MTSYIYVHILLNLIKTMFFCEHFNQNTWTLTNPRVWKSSANGQLPQIFGQFTLKYLEAVRQQNLHTRKSEEISALYAVEATFSNIYEYLFFSARLNVSIKCVQYDSHMKIFFVFPNWKNDIILKFPLLHILMWPWASICCISGCPICCLWVFNLSWSVVCNCPRSFSLQSLQITM